MNKGRLFFDPHRFKELEAQEDRRKRAKSFILLASIIVSVVFILLTVFGFSTSWSSNLDSVLISEVDSSSSAIFAVSNIIFEKNNLYDNAVLTSCGIVNNGNEIISARIEAEKKALEEQRILAEKKKKEEEENQRLLAQAEKQKQLSKKPTTPSGTQKVGGDVQKVEIDLNDEYLPVNPEDLDPTGNYGIPEYWPIQGISVSSKYGYLPERGRFHAGIDLVADSGTPICAAGAGKVIRASWFAGYGHCIDIQHSSGYITRYGHLSGYFVKVGDFVNVGDWIGSCGSTGRSSCPHLHFEVHKNGRSMNPESSSLHWAGKP
ncbi:MAG: M23 family metallopeptidase [Caldisericia bacterium]